MASLLMAVMLFILLDGWWHHVDLYESFKQGVIEGLGLLKSLLSGLLALLTMVAILESSGLLKAVADLLAGFLPAELVGMMFLRPISSQASLTFLNQLYQSYGPLHLYSRMGTLAQGATDTTLYVLSVYLSAVQIKDSGYLVWLCLGLDVLAMIFAIFFAIHIFL
ncbi:Spore maturation protein B [Clostridiales bacterium CHKCI006]|nr:Spore maturation protein B [Clostridiales bacterium CHKCI006]